MHLSSSSSSYSESNDTTLPIGINLTSLHLNNNQTSTSSSFDSGYNQQMFDNNIPYKNSSYSISDYDTRSNHQIQTTQDPYSSYIIPNSKLHN